MAIGMELLKVQRSRVPASSASRAQRQVGAKWWRPNSSPTVLLIALSSLLLFPFGCANPQNVTQVAAAQTIQVSSELARDQVINRHLETDPRTLDPSLSEDVVGSIVLDDLFEGLTTAAIDGSVIPGVATSWETSADGKTWTFHLRKEARWSNGEPVTADDFVYAWRREVDPATTSEYSQALAPIENALDIAAGKMPIEKLGVESMGPQTLVVHLSAPTPYLLALVGNNYLFPLYAPAVKQWGDAWTQPAHMISNGPFVLSDRVLNGHITLLKNSHYWDAAHVRLTRVNYLVVEDSTATMDQYLAGDLDFTNRLPAPEKDRLQQMLGDQVVLSPYFATGMFSFNVGKQPFINNQKLRVALSAAVDRDVFVKYVMRGIGVPAYDIMPPLMGYDPAIPDWAKMAPDARHAYARSLYQQAGYSDNNPLEIVLTYPSAGPDFRRQMEALAAMWQINLGAKVQIYNVEWKVFLQAKQQRQPLLYWDAWTGDFPDPFTFFQLFQTGNGQNSGDYSNPQYDALIDQASNTSDAAKRFQLFRQAEVILNNDAATIPVFFWENARLVKPYVKGWQSNVMDHILSRYVYILAHQES
jgi:oligopeptide transport system substrate-binding protein